MSRYAPDMSLPEHVQAALREWGELQELFDQEPAAGPLFDVSPSPDRGSLFDRVLIGAWVVDAMVQRVEEAANKAIRAAIAAGLPVSLDLSTIIPEGWEYEVVEACDRPPQVVILRTS